MWNKVFGSSDSSHTDLAALSPTPTPAVSEKSAAPTKSTEPTKSKGPAKSKEPVKSRAPAAGGGGGGGGGGPLPDVDLSIDEMGQIIAAHGGLLSNHSQALNLANHRVQELHQHLQATDSRVNQMQHDIQRNDKKAMRGIASVAAMSNAVQPSAPGKTVVGVGVATYEGVQGFAINVNHRPEKLSQMSFQGAIATSSGGKPVMRVGASYEF
jgi:autotransporter adhesin